MEFVSFDDFAERECWWFNSFASVNNGYGCDHPAQQETDIAAQGDDEQQCLVKQGKCYSWSCPLGYEVNPTSNPADAERLRQAGLDPDHFEDGALLLLVD